MTNENHPIEAPIVSLSVTISPVTLKPIGREEFDRYAKSHILALDLQRQNKRFPLTHLYFNLATALDPFHPKYLWPGRFNHDLYLAGKEYSPKPSKNQESRHQSRISPAALNLLVERTLAGVLVIRRNRQGTITQLEESLAQCSRYGEIGECAAYVHDPRRRGWLGPYSQQPSLLLFPLYKRD